MAAFVTCSFEVQYIVMAFVMLHNLCIAAYDPCLLRWQIKVQQLENFKKCISRNENYCDLTRLRIFDWLLKILYNRSSKYNTEIMKF